MLLEVLCRTWPRSVRLRRSSILGNNLVHEMRILATELGALLINKICRYSVQGRQRKICYSHTVDGEASPVALPASRAAVASTMPQMSKSIKPIIAITDSELSLLHIQSISIPSCDMIACLPTPLLSGTLPAVGATRYFAPSCETLSGTGVLSAFRISCPS